MPAPTNNTELRNTLLDTYNKVRTKRVAVPQANAEARLANFILKTVVVDIAYANNRGETVHNDFMETPERTAARKKGTLIRRK